MTTDAEKYAFEAASINYVLLFGGVNDVPYEGSRSRHRIIFEPDYSMDPKRSAVLFRYLEAMNGAPAIKWDTVKPRTENVHYTRGTFDETGSTGDTFTVDFETVDGRSWMCSVRIDSMAHALEEILVMPGMDRVWECAVLANAHRSEAKELLSERNYFEFPLVPGVTAGIFGVDRYGGRGHLTFTGAGNKRAAFGRKLRGF